MNYKSQNRREPKQDTSFFKPGWTGMFVLVCTLSPEVTRKI